MRALPRSLPRRVTLVVVLSFLLLSVIAAVLMVRGFRDHLEAQVRDADAAVLDRQVSIIADVQVIVDNMSPELAAEMTTEDEFRSLFGGGFTVVPDDGTLLSIINAESGEVYGTSADAFEALQSMFSAEATLENVETASSNLASLERAISELDSEAAVSATEALSELRSLLLGEVDEMSEEEFEVLIEANSELSSALFGVAGGPTSLEGVPVIRTVRETELAGVPLQVLAESSAIAVEDAVSPVRRLMWFVVPLLTLLVGMIAWLTTRRSLRPVESITRRVHEVTAQDMSGRVPVPDSRDEIEDLATTMNTMLDRLETAQENQSRFFADASHELRTPIATIAAELEVAQAIGDANDWDRSAEVILAEQRRLSALVDDLLFLARIRENPRGSRSELDLDDIVRTHATRPWSVDVSAAHVRPVRMHGEPRQLDRLVQNAVANATRHASSQVQISLERNNQTVTLTVDDDGDGVPADDRERVFERFTRLEEARQRDAGGAGLGLAMIREVALAHEGSAELEESPLGGARLIATFQVGS